MTASKLKLILTAALFAVPMLAFAQGVPNVSNAVLLDICSESEDLATPAACEEAERDYLAGPATAQAPPPNWEMTIPGARQFAKDVCTERDSLRSDRACYAAFLRQQIINREEARAAGITATPRRVHWITLEDICPFADAGPGETILVTDERNPPLECPSEPDSAP